MLMIRFQRIGRTNDPAFRIVVLEKERAAKAGNVVEQLGTYNPRSKALTLDAEAVKKWIANGAQPTGSIPNIPFAYMPGRTKQHCAFAPTADIFQETLCIL